MSHNVLTRVSAGTTPVASSLSPFGEFRFAKLQPPKWRQDLEFLALARAKFDEQLRREGRALRIIHGRKHARRMVGHWREGMDLFGKRCFGQPTWIALGTARDAAMHQHDAEFLHCFGSLAGFLGLGCVDGWASTGIMGAASRSQVAGWQNSLELALNAPLIGVPLKFREHTTEIPFSAAEHIDAEWAKDEETLKQCVWVCPKQGTIQTRTAFGLFGLSEILVSIFLAGGQGTDEESATDALGRQMRNAILTHYSGYREDCIPRRVWIDSPLQSGKWFLDGKLQHERAKLERGTINRADVADIVVIRLGKKPRKPGWLDLAEAGVQILYFDTAAEAAAAVMRIAIRTYKALNRCYAETADIATADQIAAAN